MGQRILVVVNQRGGATYCGYAEEADCAPGVKSLRLWQPLVWVEQWTPQGRQTMGRSASTIEIAPWQNIDDVAWVRGTDEAVRAQYEMEIDVARKIFAADKSVLAPGTEDAMRDAKNVHDIAARAKAH